MSKRVTLQQVADKAGVSMMTVSRAMRGRRGVSPEEKARILALADRLGYRPDPMISRLMNRLRGSRLSGAEPIAWITSHDTRAGWKKNPACTLIHRGAVARAEILGYRLDEFWVREPGLSGQRLGDILETRAIRGVVVAPLPSPGELPALPWQKFASACCGYSLLRPPLHRAASNQFQAFQVAWEALATRGYQRIGLCMPQDLGRRVNRLWQGAHAVAQAETPARRRIPALITPDWSEPVFRRWFTQHRPDAVISLGMVNDWLKALGVKVPVECGFADINGTEPHLAGVNHHLEQLGAAAVDLVAGELAADQVGLPLVPRSVMVECGWKDGASVRPVNAN